MKLKVNSYRPSPIVYTVLDLHGYSINDAYIKTNEFIYDSYINNVKNITIITGKSGKIQKEFKIWVSANKYVKNLKIENNGGSYKLDIKKQGTIK